MPSFFEEQAKRTLSLEDLSDQDFFRAYFRYEAETNCFVRKSATDFAFEAGLQVGRAEGEKLARSHCEEEHKRRGERLGLCALLLAFWGGSIWVVQFVLDKSRTGGGAMIVGGMWLAALGLTAYFKSRPFQETPATRNARISTWRASMKQREMEEEALKAAMAEETAESGKKLGVDYVR